MIVIGRTLLDDFKAKHVQSRKPLDSWERKIRRNNYQSFIELRETFPKADYVYHQYTIFNIAGNKYRLITAIDYSKNAIVVKKAWTHAEYDKKRNHDLLRGWKL